MRNIAYTTFRTSKLTTFVFHAISLWYWLSTFFKNNTYFETNSANKYILKVNKTHTRARRELFSKLTRKQNDHTDVVRIYLLLALNTFHTLRYCFYYWVWLLLNSNIKLEKKCSCFNFGFWTWKVISIINHIEDKFFSNSFSFSKRCYVLCVVWKKFKVTLI